MSTYSKQTKHPITGEWHEATWMDDFYGKHRYGVRFPDGETFNPDKIQLETREDEPQDSTTKKKFEDAYQRFQMFEGKAEPAVTVNVIRDIMEKLIK